MLFFFFKQKTAYEMRIRDWSADVCSSDLVGARRELQALFIDLHEGCLFQPCKRADTAAQRRRKVELPSHRTFRDRRDLGLLARHVAQLVDALEARKSFG